jgi:membrane protein implicated in regulation of membrane protease activity
VAADTWGLTSRANAPGTIETVDAWVIWLIVAVLFGVGEIATLGFFLAPFAAGALVAAVVAGAGAGAIAAWAVFLVVSLVALAALRPVAARHMRQAPRLRTGTAALVGRTGTVVERVAGDEGCVRIEGEIWTARPYDEDEVIEAGKRVHVLEIRGATALVAAE